MSDSSPHTLAYICPICGRKHPGAACNPKSLSGIDGANTRAANDELDPTSYEPRRPSIGERLEFGFSEMERAEHWYYGDYQVRNQI